MRGGDGQTPLHVARSVEVARLLLEHGADVDAIDVDHESTPAQYLVRDRQDVVRYLIERGCRTDVMMAAAIGDAGLVRTHLDADPRCVHVTVDREHFPMRNWHAGGHIYTWTLGTHKTPHRVARDFGRDDVYRLLLEHSPDELKLTVAVEAGDDALAGSLLARHPDFVDRMGPGGRRRLVDAARNNETDVVRRFVGAGWPLDVRGQHAATSLHWAAFHGNTAMVRELVRAGADVHARGDEFDNTPLGWAIFGSTRGWYADSGDYAGSVSALLDAGAAPPPLEGVVASDAVLAVLRRRAASP
jgi:ankyrin repeat protein